jgi:hypothetical protein
VLSATLCLVSAHRLAEDGPHLLRRAPAPIGQVDLVVAAARPQSPGCGEVVQPGNVRALVGVGTAVHELDAGPSSKRSTRTRPATAGPSFFAILANAASYPVSFSVDYPDRDLDRTTSALRIFTVIPIAIVLGAVAGGTWEWSSGNGPRGSPRARAGCCSSARS